MGKSQLQEYISTNLDFGKDLEGSLGLSNFDFYEDHIDIVFTSHFDEIGSESENLRVTKLETFTHEEQHALEIMIDENFINSVLAALYHQDKSFGLREFLGADSATDQYSMIVAAVLKTNIVGEAWKEILDEFGPDKKVDAQCGFGKSLFAEHIRNIRPSGIEFKEGSNLNTRIAFGCSIVVEEEEGKWENFRSFYGEFQIDLFLKLLSDDAAKKVLMDGKANELKNTKLKIFKKDEAQLLEETTLSMMINMGLSMAKSQVTQALTIPSMGYPTLKSCLGISLRSPSITIHEGYLMIATDLDVEAGSLDCSEETNHAETEKSSGGFTMEAMTPDDLEQEMIRSGKTEATKETREKVEQMMKDKDVKIVEKSDTDEL